MRVTYFAAISEDGFIAREDGDVSWLDDIEIEDGGDSTAEFFASVDALVMGRATYDFVFNYGSWPYEDKPSWIITSKPLTALAGANLKVVDSVQAFAEAAADQGLKHVWFVGGGKLASAFLQRGLLTDLSLTVLPTTLGKGLPLIAGHDVDELAFAERAVEQHSGYRTIEIVLEPSQASE